MKAWTLIELENVVSSLEPLVGLRLQEVQTGASEVVLGFYSSSGVLWLWIDLHAIHPSLLPWTVLPRRPEVQKTPLQLFLRAHFVGRVLREVARPKALGRVVVLRFGANEDHLELEVRLFPHGRNLLARAGAKHISWQKPKELSPPSEATSVAQPPRCLEDLRQEWLRGQKVVRGGIAKKGGGVDVKARLQHEIEKKEKALGKVREELKRKQELPWRAIADWLKTHQSVQVPAEWEPFVDRRRKLAWNIEHCYTKARESDGKIVGTQKREELLLAEIGKLEQRILQPETQLLRQVESKKPQPSLAKIEARGRTLHLSDGTMAVMGKSAVDNLKILRKARAWDLWFHMRDYPSSHAVLFRNKGAKTTDAQLLEVVGWFVRNHLGEKASAHAGEKFDVAIAECRFVRPVKGDKIGRVTYHDERVLIYQFPG